MCVRWPGGGGGDSQVRSASVPRSIEQQTSAAPHTPHPTPHTHPYMHTHTHTLVASPTRHHHTHHMCAMSHDTCPRLRFLNSAAPCARTLVGPAPGKAAARTCPASRPSSVHVPRRVVCTGCSWKPLPRCSASGKSCAGWCTPARSAPWEWPAFDNVSLLARRHSPRAPAARLLLSRNAPGAPRSTKSAHASARRVAAEAAAHRGRTSVSRMSICRARNPCAAAACTLVFLLRSAEAWYHASQSAFVAFSPGPDTDQLAVAIFAARAPRAPFPCPAPRRARRPCLPLLTGRPLEVCQLPST